MLPAGYRTLRRLQNGSNVIFTPKALQSVSCSQIPIELYAPSIAPLNQQLGTPSAHTRNHHTNSNTPTHRTRTRHKNGSGNRSHLTHTGILHTTTYAQRRQVHTESAKRFSYLSYPFWLALLFWMAVAYRVLKKKEQTLDDADKEKLSTLEDLTNQQTMWTWQTVSRLAYIPTRGLSRAWGSFAHFEFPSPIQYGINYLYAKGTGCNLQEAEHSLEAYPSLSHFFQRKLVPGARPISNSLLVSPVDGKVVRCGIVDTSNSTIEQVKGVDYSLAEFVGVDSALHSVIAHHRTKASSSNLYYAVLYLAPGDYHCYHAPANFTATSRTHFPGHLYPVAEWAVKSVRNLFAINERVLLEGEWEHGYFGFCPVGAYNVGSIEFDFDPHFHTNIKGESAKAPATRLQFPEEVKFDKGNSIGAFNLGSSIVMLFEAPPFEFTIKPGDVVTLGQPIGTQLDSHTAKDRLESLEELVVRKHEALDQELKAIHQEKSQLQQWMKEQSLHSSTPIATSTTASSDE
eukprot:TRINITY_DN4285_c0_g1_i1.p1 TRINITY_DN4285_c0_g1~~TRINITY_DN4285_c0_g1_i1.p1  ORF type:complete len:540 (-),score=110.92 TRINITY_DN4285_c0_g1_i1:107-1648(-)